MWLMNWLFSNTPNGADSSALLYSITQSCLMNELMPYSQKMITKFHMNNETD